jgi:hypothetical protein
VTLVEINFWHQKTLKSEKEKDTNRKKGYQQQTKAQEFNIKTS